MSLHPDLVSIHKDFEVLANDIRLQIVYNLWLGHNAGIKLNMSQAIAPFDLPRSSITHHMNILEDRGFIERERHGREVLLTLRTGCLERVGEFVSKFHV